MNPPITKVRDLRPPAGRFDDDDLFPANDSGPATPSVPRTLVEAARVLSKAGPVARMPTGIPTLDEAMRGGVPVPRFMVIGGAPGAGKTSLAVWLGVEAARKGTPVAFLAVDEGVEGIVMRAAQILGCRTQDLEAGSEEEWGHALEAMDQLPILVFDADEEDATIEKVAAALHTYAAGKPAIMVLDSLQTIRCELPEGTAKPDGPRARIDLVVRAAKRETMHRGFVTLATCELARGSYRSKAAADQIEDIAAFKESGSIEYAGQTLLVLRNVPKAEDLIDVAVPKNRAQRKKPFRLRMDHRRASFEEVPMPEKDEIEPRSGLSDVDADAEKIATFLVEHPGVAGEGKLRSEMRAAGNTMSNGRIAIAIAKLGNRIENRGPSNRPRWFLRTDLIDQGDADE